MNVSAVPERPSVLRTKSFNNTNRKRRDGQTLIRCMIPDHSKSTANSLTRSTNSPAPPSLYILNANSTAKPHAIEQLTVELIGYNTDIAIITESHLKKKHSEAQCLVNGYTSIRRDREVRRAGGVIVYVRNEYSSTICVIGGDDRKFE